MVIRIHDPKVKSTIARKILSQLPEWFGIPAATEEYIETSQSLPFFSKRIDDNDIGFIALKETSPYTAEIYCIAVTKAAHQKGFGKELILHVEEYAVKQGYLFLQVKTVASGHYSNYDQTNRFYRSVGFRELEVFPTLWDAKNPCQVYVKSLTKTSANH